MTISRNSSLPRYTSYPTAAEFAPVDNLPLVIANFRNAIANARDLSLYVHIPFCPSLCYFCACNKVITKDAQRISNYLKTLAQEASLLHQYLGRHQKVVQLHLGGGSPSYLNSEQLTYLLEALDQFSFTQDCTKSIEVDPRTFTLENLERLYRAGFRRFSLGVQDFDPQVQKLINRVQPQALTAAVFQSIRAYPNTQINIDLIYGLPGQTVESFQKTVEAINKLRPDRLAVYGYAHVKWKVKVQNVFEKYALPSPTLRQALFSVAQHGFESAGYIHIGLDHFALPSDELVSAQQRGDLHRNFMGYTVDRGEVLLALGLSAIADGGKLLTQNTGDQQRYEHLVGSGNLPIERVIYRSVEDEIRSSIIEQLMCNRSVSLLQLHAEFPGENVESIYDDGISHLRDLEQDGVVLIDSDTIRIPETAFSYLRHVASRFDRYLEPSQNSRFSAAV